MTAEEARSLTANSLAADGELVGPVVKEALNAVRAAALDGHQRTRYDLAFRRDAGERRRQSVTQAVVKHLQGLGYRVELKSHPSDPRDGTGGGEYLTLSW